MESYELTAVLSVKENMMQEGKEALEKELNKQQFSFEKVKDMGQRLLAYPINKEERGHYLCYTLQGEKQLVEQLRAALLQVAGVLRFLIVDPIA